jgi:hypothetical protein
MGGMICGDYIEHSLFKPCPECLFIPGAANGRIHLHPGPLLVIIIGGEKEVIGERFGCNLRRLSLSQSCHFFSSGEVKNMEASAVSL